MITKSHIHHVAGQWSHDELLRRYVDLHVAYNDNDNVKHHYINAEWIAMRRYKIAESKIKKFLTTLKALGTITPELSRRTGG